MRISNNTNNFCGYCLPSQSLHPDILSNQHPELLPLLTGNTFEASSLLSNNFANITTSDSLKHQSIETILNNNNNTTHNNNNINYNNNLSDILVRDSYGDVIHSKNMVSTFQSDINSGLNCKNLNFA